MTLRRRFHHQGFTLVEMLISVALLSLVMLALGAALRSAALSEVRVDQRLAESDEFRSANAFLRSILGRVSIRRVPGVVSTDGSKVHFDGKPDRMVWVGVMPARNGTGGRHFFTLGVEQTDSGLRGLVVRYVPWTDRQELPDWATSEARVLASNVEGLGIRYESATGTWDSQWRDRDTAPRRIVLAIGTAALAWPDISIALRTPGTAGTGGFTIGGTTE